MLQKVSSAPRFSFSARTRKDKSGERVNSAQKDEKTNKSVKTSSIRIQSATQEIQNGGRLSSTATGKRPKVPQYLKEMNIQDKKQNDKIISNMNKRINYAKNPRYKIVRPPIQFTEVHAKPQLEVGSNSKESIFRAIPSSLLFQNYMIHEVYEIDLKIVNISAVSQRIKYLPPSSNQFAVTKVIYPSENIQKYDSLQNEGYLENPQKEKGMIAPGMCFILKVKFFATSFSEFRDEITFISEENVFKVPIIAQKEAPQINLPDVLDCQSCWLGDKAEKVFRVQNKGGEAGFKFFCENENEYNKQIGDVLNTECFTLSPCEFYIQKNEIIELFATFTPKTEGVSHEKIILACDNLSSIGYILQGTGNMTELGIYGLDNIVFSEINKTNEIEDRNDSTDRKSNFTDRMKFSIDNLNTPTDKKSNFDLSRQLSIKNMKEETTKSQTSKQSLKQIFFEKASPGTVIKRTLIIENLALVRVKFHWSVYKGESINKGLQIDKEEEYCFKIEPMNGFFEKGEIKEFVISYNSKDPIPVFEYCSLIIDNISLESIRNPPESIMRMKLAKQQEIQQSSSNSSSALLVHKGKPLLKPGFIGSNSDRPSITYFEFELIGLSTYSAVNISPPFYAFSGDLFSGKIYYKEFLLTNSSKSTVYYNISTVQNLCHPYISTDIPKSQGSIPPNGSSTLKLGYQCSLVGQNRSVTFKVDFDKDHSQMIELIGNFIGPKVIASVPVVNVGIVKAGDISKYKFELRNESDVDAEILFRDLVDQIKDGSFESLKEKTIIDEKNRKNEREDQFLYKRDEDEKFYKKARQRVTITPQYAIIPQQGKIEIEVRCGCEDSAQINRIIECKIKNSQSIFISILAEIQRIHVSLNRSIFQRECLYASNHYVFAAKKTPDYLEIQNLGNLPCSFEWEPESQQSERRKQLMKYSFTPSKGIVPPKSKIQVIFELWPLQGGSFEEFFILNCEGQDFPLGFQFTTNVLGLTVVYEKLDDGLAITGSPHSIKNPSSPTNNSIQSINKNDIKGEKSSSPSQVISPKSRSSRRRQSALLQITEDKPKNNKLEGFEYYDCLINKSKTIKICIRNTSGVNTTFEVFSEKYRPFQDKIVESAIPIKTEDDLSILSGEINDSAMNSLPSAKGIRFSQTVKDSDIQKLSRRESNIRIGKISLKQLPPKPIVLLTDENEQLNKFASVQGQALSQTKKLEKDQRVYLSNNKGIAICNSIIFTSQVLQSNYHLKVCEPEKGKLKGHSEIVIKVTCFNDICGHFQDNLIIEVKGLPQAKFPLVAEIKGSPVIVTPHQLGMDYKEDWPSYLFGTYMRNIPTTKREFKIKNTGPKDITLDWKLFNLSDQHNHDNVDFLNVKITDPHLGSDNVCLVQLDALEPPECEESPFNIVDRNIVIQARKEKIIQIEYNSSQDTSYRYVMVGKPKLLNPRDSYILASDNIDEQQVSQPPPPNMGIVAVYLRATSILPELYFDKLKNLDGAHKLTFEKWALSENKKQSKEICLVNQHESNLLLTVQIVGPFKLLSTVTNSPAKYDPSKIRLLSANRHEIETQFNLVQNSNLKMNILFDGPQISDYGEWPLTYKVYKYGVVNLFYSNGDSQVIELEGRLLRPHIQLNTSGTEDFDGKDIQDFGVVHIDNTKTISVFLSNQSSVPANWKINHLKSIQKRTLSAISQNTITKTEIEDTVRTDDSTVFEFQITQGTLLGPSAPVKSFPDGLALPGKKINSILQQEGLYPQKICINFRPKKNILYKSKFRITVQEGPFIDFILRGTGSYSENKLK